MSKNLRTLLPLAAIVLIASCDSVDQASTYETTERYAPAGSGEDVDLVEKSYVFANLAPFFNASLADGPGFWSLQWKGQTESAGITTFEYDVTPPAAPGGNLTYEVPGCATYDSSDPAPDSFDGTTLQWSAATLAGGKINIGFVTPAGRPFVRAGVVDVAVVGGGSDLVVGPCARIVELQGTVFLNDTSEEGGTSNDTKDPDEPGIGNVEVIVQYKDASDGVWKEDVPSGASRQLTGNSGGAVGTYSFEVLDIPSVIGYRIVVPTSSSNPDAINSSLFGTNSLFQVACLPSPCPFETDPPTKEADLGNLIDIDFGFELDVDGAITKVQTGLIESDALPREYWLWQTRFRRGDDDDDGGGEDDDDGGSALGKRPWPRDFTKREFADLLNCSLQSFDPPGPIECIYDPTGNPNDFSGDVDDLIRQILPIDLRRDFLEAKKILQKIKPPRGDGDGDDDDDDGEGDDDDDDGPPPFDPDREYRRLQLELQQQILVSLLNFTVGRGICVDGLGGDGRCLTFDEGASRAIYNNAIVVLVNSEFTVLGKASRGSVGSNTELLSSLNN
jgi:hypothetical protein